MRDDEPLVQIRTSRYEARLWRDADEFVHGIGHADAAARAGSDDDGWSRRAFMKLLGASVAAAALEGCGRSPPEAIVPYSVQPRDVEPGIPRWYATSAVLDGFADGLLVETHEGRPTKVEGNPDHPSSLGGTMMWHQALVLGLYDPDRARNLLHEGVPSTWEALDERLRRPRTDRGAGLRLLLPSTTSPTLVRMLQLVRQAHPECKVTFHDAVAPLENTIAGARLAFGQPLQPVYDFAAADTILVLDADPLGMMPMATAYARAWAQRRRIAAPGDSTSRMYAVECTPSVTGLIADHRLRRRSAEVAHVARQIAAGLPALAAPLRPSLGKADAFATAAARDLAARGAGKSLVVAGERQPPAVHALAFAMNAALGNIGRTVRLIPPQLAPGDQPLSALVGELRAGHVDTLLILDGNPVYDAPAELELDRAMARAPERIYLGAYENETALAATWVAPLAHPFESWGDARAYDGTLSFIQPLIRPLHGGRTAIEFCAAMAGARQADGRRLVADTHGAGFDFARALEDGVVPGSAAATVAAPPVDAAAIARALGALAPPPDGAIEINFQPSPTVHDGRFSNNPWLLEQPTPVGKLCWDNAVLVSPATATRLGLHSQDLVDVELLDRRVRGPILVLPGHADESATLWLGWGRQGRETLARGRGFNAYLLRTSQAPAFADGHLRRAPGTQELATTQRHFDMHGRPIAIAVTADEYRKNPDFAEDEKGEVASLMPPKKLTGNQWAMSIDLSICTGCSSCVVACQAENNVPVVGKPSVIKGREMHWLRIDTYYSGTLENPGVVHQPMLCQHCEYAPCEYVCPVNATVHSDDGLNEMVYNRCVGTRFCSNNCPYKVRRFNWFNWYKREPENLGGAILQHNPDVTTRERGVMEKCSYCVQRIRRAEIRATVEGRTIRPGEVVTACQQACPTGAIQFGSLTHEETPMVKWRQEPRSYQVLHDMGTQPRTMYLARVENPNPELK